MPESTAIKRKLETDCSLFDHFRRTEEGGTVCEVVQMEWKSLALKLSAKQLKRFLDARKLGSA